MASSDCAAVYSKGFSGAGLASGRDATVLNFHGDDENGEVSNGKEGTQRASQFPRQKRPWSFS